MPLKVIGRYPDSDAIISPKGYVDARWAAVRVDSDYIDSIAAPLAATLTTQTYVDSRDALKATKVFVDNQDALYVPTSQRGAANGVAPLNSSIQVPAINVPSGIATERLVIAAPAASVVLGASQIVSSTSNTKEFLAATITVADPGYPWLPLIDGAISGFANNGGDPGNGLGVGVYGQALVFDSANNVWARAVTDGNFRTASYPMQPWAGAAAVPTSITGGTSLLLYLSLYSRPGSVETYTFTNVNLVYEALIMAAL